MKSVLNSIDKIKMNVQGIISYLTSVGVRYDYVLLRLATVLLEATTGSFLDIFQKINT